MIRQVRISSRDKALLCSPGWRGACPSDRRPRAMGADLEEAAHERVRGATQGAWPSHRGGPTTRQGCREGWTPWTERASYGRGSSQRHRPAVELVLEPVHDFQL